jgi:hypothetical protein
MWREGEGRVFPPLRSFNTHNASGRNCALRIGGTLDQARLFFRQYDHFLLMSGQQDHKASVLLAASPADYFVE